MSSERISSSSPGGSDPKGPGSRALLHPASGLGILVLDWLIFGGNAASAGAAAPLWLLGGFAIATVWVYFVQRRFARDPKWPGVVKAILCGSLVGVPFPVAGTAAGTLVLTLSGLRHLTAKRLQQPARQKR